MAFYDQLANNLKIDEINPRPANSFRGRLNSEEEFGGKEPTLSGRVVDVLYGDLITRSLMIPRSRERSSQLIDASIDSRDRAKEKIETINRERQAKGLRTFSLTSDIDYSQTGFHFHNKGPVDGYNLHFHMAERPDSPRLRAYITLSLDDIDQVADHFIDLSNTLYNAGVNFSGKVDSPAGAAERTENMVFYINDADQPKAAEIIRNFLSTNRIGEGHVLAAIPSKQEGLSWAFEPGQAEVKLYQEITGSIKNAASFNQFASAMTIPTYLTRLANAHATNGNTLEAETFRKEAERVRTLIRSYESSLPKPPTPKGGITGRVSQAGERLQSTLRRSEGSKPERFDYKKAYVERFTRDGEKTSEDGADNYVYPPDIRQGWQLHLNLVAKSSNLLPEIYSFLKENGLFGEFRYSENPDDQGIFSIYVGNRNDSLKFARLIQEKFGDRLAPPTQTMKLKDTPLLGRDVSIGASFDLTEGQKVDGLPKVDEMFKRGSGGLIYLEQDAPRSSYASVRPEDIDQIVANADAQFRKVFGAFYTGSGENEFNPINRFEESVTSTRTTIPPQRTPIAPPLPIISPTPAPKTASAPVFTNRPHLPPVSPIPKGSTTATQPNST